MSVFDVIVGEMWPDSCWRHCVANDAFHGSFYDIDSTMPYESIGVNSGCLHIQRMNENILRHHNHCGITFFGPYQRSGTCRVSVLGEIFAF